MPTYREGDKKIHLQNWESHVDQMIREAQARGDFDNVPGMGKPLDLEGDNPFNPEWSAAFRVAKNAGAAPIWVQLDKEIGAEAAALRDLLERTACYLEAAAARIRRLSGTSDMPSSPGLPDTSGPVAATAATARPQSRPAQAGHAAAPGRRWWPFRRTGPSRAVPAQPAPATLPSSPQTLHELETERLRARARYLAKAAELDEKIVEFNTHRPRNLAWLEKPRLLPERAAQRFDRRCPPMCGQWPVGNGQ